MSFVATIFGHLTSNPDKPYITEMYGVRPTPTDGRVLLDLAGRVRGFARAHGLRRGDRVVLLAHNSARWVAADLGLLAEGLVVVPMYARQKSSEVAAMIRDCGARSVFAGDTNLVDHLAGEDLGGAGVFALSQVFAEGDPISGPPVEAEPDELVTLIYTSGSTGEPKGVMLTMANVDYMLPQTATALSRMMALGGAVSGDDIVFHYLPFCFAGSRVVLWTCLYRNNGLFVSTNLDDLQAELGAVAPHYFLNVPVLLERIKNGVEANLRNRPYPLRALYDGARAAYTRKVNGRSSFADPLTLSLAQTVLFRAIRARIGPNLRCLICGSAPLGEDTQRWFEMLGLPVYQVYGLTETTAIVTMDTPEGRVVAGRVGPALRGVQVRLGEGDEMQIRGPNVTPGYWNKAEATRIAFTDDGWFRTGDRGEVDQEGNWKIVGRLKNLLIPTSGHNVAPEPIEQLLVERIEGVEQALLVGHGRPFLAALLTGTADAATIQRGVDRINEELPHYKRVRAFRRLEERFTVENGLLTANQKVRRDVIERHHADVIASFYP
jgi:long-chain acyl-CoA synthetase